MKYSKTLFAVLTAFFFSALVQAVASEVIPIQVRENLRIVYQVTDDAPYEGVNSNEVLPGVKLVVGAFPRLIDLQLQGFAYIKFE